jgi:hypothetical protein
MKKIKRFENDKIAFNYPEDWYEFDNGSKNPNEIVAMKTDKMKGGTFSFSIANSTGKNSEEWGEFMKNFLSDNGAKIISYEIKEYDGIPTFDFETELEKSGIISKQRHFGFVNNGLFFYSFFTSLDLEALKEDIDIILAIN